MSLRLTWRPRTGWRLCSRSLGTSRSEIVPSVLNILGTCLCCQMECFNCYGKSFWIHFYVPQLDLEVRTGWMGCRMKFDLWFWTCFQVSGNCMSFGPIWTSLQWGHFDDPTGRSRTGWRGCRMKLDLWFVALFLEAFWTLLASRSQVRPNDLYHRFCLGKMQLLIPTCLIANGSI